MKKSILLILFFVSFTLQAQTDVSGDQSGTWSMNGSPYHVTGEITVPQGETLIIEPGVTINFLGHYKLTVHGQLTADGSVTDSIVFKAQNASEGWGGIRIDGSQVSTFKYCIIENGRTTGDYPDIHGGAVALFTANAQFEHCLFRNNNADNGEDGMGGAVYAANAGSQTKFTDCKFINNHTFGEGGAIKFSGGNNVTILRCKFTGNNCKYGGGAISYYSAAGMKAAFCLFADNYTLYSSGGAVQTLGVGNEVTFENCTFYGNSANNGDGGAVSLAYADAVFVNTIVYNNPGAYSDDVYLDIAGFAEVNYCDMPMPDGATGSNNINEDPKFISVTGKDFRLSEDSPCIDAGLDIGYEFLGTAPDMGCFEFDPATDVQKNNETANIRIYPNPVTEKLFINTTGDKILSVEVLNMTGKVLEKTAQPEISFNSFKSGVYLIKVKTPKGTFTQKIIKR